MVINSVVKKERKNWSDWEEGAYRSGERSYPEWKIYVLWIHVNLEWVSRCKFG